ncbi:hypothetical protein Droror1_Dr00004002 [Drosera rotundifolia]
MGFRFGFDAITGDYKVVSFLLCRNEAEIFSLNETRLNCISVSCIPPEAVHCKYAKDVFLNGVIHWICNTKSSFFILTFDVHGEFLGTMSTPSDPITKPDFAMVEIDELKDCLALCCHLGEEGCTIWRMAE